MRAQQLERLGLLARHRWPATLLADWPADDCRELARLIRRFTDDITQQLQELDR
jgi:hypothetical protein